MWYFTKVADWFDKTRAENEAWIDGQLQKAFTARNIFGIITSVTSAAPGGKLEDLLSR